MTTHDEVKKPFERHGHVMRTAELRASKIYYEDIHRLMSDGMIEKSDIGVGDIIVPRAEIRKFNAILQRFELTGQMKDFYDIYYLARTFDFDGAKLQSALFETLQRRGTPYEKDSFIRIMQLVDDEDILNKWKYFLKNIRNDLLAFSIVINELEAFLEPVYDAIITETEFQGIWKCKESLWLQL